MPVVRPDKDRCLAPLVFFSFLRFLSMASSAPIETVMAGGGHYNQHSASQSLAVERTLPFIDHAVRTWPVLAADQLPPLIMVADYGRQEETSRFL